MFWRTRVFDVSRGLTVRIVIDVNKKHFCCVNWRKSLLMTEIEAPGGHNKDSGICGLCFIGSTAQSEAIFTDIRKYEGILMDIFGAEVRTFLDVLVFFNSLIYLLADYQRQ